MSFIIASSQQIFKLDYCYHFEGNDKDVDMGIKGRPLEITFNSI